MVFAFLYRSLHLDHFFVWLISMYKFHILASQVTFAVLFINIIKKMIIKLFLWMVCEKGPYPYCITKCSLHERRLLIFCSRMNRIMVHRHISYPINEDAKKVLIVLKSVDCGALIKKLYMNAYFLWMFPLLTDSEHRTYSESHCEKELRVNTCSS